MKKLKLSLDDLEVTSFSAQDRGGRAVHALDSYETRECFTWEYECPDDFTKETRCQCTDAEGCYPSLYCSGAWPGQQNVTCLAGCMTNENGVC